MRRNLEGEASSIQDVMMLLSCRRSSTRKRIAVSWMTKTFRMLLALPVAAPEVVAAPEAANLELAGAGAAAGATPVAAAGLVALAGRGVAIASIVATRVAETVLGVMGGSVAIGPAAGSVVHARSTAAGGGGVAIGTAGRSEVAVMDIVIAIAGAGVPRESANSSRKRMLGGLALCRAVALEIAAQRLPNWLVRLVGGLRSLAQPTTRWWQRRGRASKLPWPRQSVLAKTHRMI